MCKAQATRRKGVKTHCQSERKALKTIGRKQTRDETNVDMHANLKRQEPIKQQQQYGRD
jgi:hypothetical protein